MLKKFIDYNKKNINKFMFVYINVFIKFYNIARKLEL